MKIPNDILYVRKIYIWSEATQTLLVRSEVAPEIPLVRPHPPLWWVLPPPAERQIKGEKAKTARLEASKPKRGKHANR